MMEGSIPPSSFSTPTPASSSEPATPRLFKPRRSEDWKKFRDVIEQLYRNDQLKLKDVKRIMEQEHGFVATEKQYKDRLAAWGVRKNIKAKEINIMIRKQEQRAARGKQTVFRVAGHRVDRKRITRFVRRHGSKLDGNESRPIGRPQESPEPCMSSRGVTDDASVNVGIATPSDMSYYTPEPDERATTLSPHPENHPLPFVHSDSFPSSEFDDQKTNPMTHSPITLTNHTAQNPMDEKYSINDVGAYEKFQKKMREVNASLEEATKNFYSVEDPNNQPQYC
ncbi:hypothetical protein BDV06DRAFT_189052 [Aspergillus oleicola]